MKTEDIVLFLFLGIAIFVIGPLIGSILKIVFIVGGILAVYVLLNYKKTRSEIAEDPDEYFRKQKEERDSEE